MNPETLERLKALKAAREGTAAPAPAPTVGLSPETLQRLKAIKAARAPEPDPEPPPQPAEEPNRPAPKPVLSPEGETEEAIAKAEAYGSDTVEQPKQVDERSLEQMLDEMFYPQSRQASPEEEAAGPDVVTEVGPGGETIRAEVPRNSSMANEIERAATAHRTPEDIVQGTAPKKPEEVQPSLGQSLGFDRESTVGDIEKPYVGEAPEEISIADLEGDRSRLPPSLRLRVEKFLRENVPQEAIETPADMAFFPSPFIAEGGEAPLKNVKVDPFAFTSGDMMRRPNETIDDLASLYMMKLVRESGKSTEMQIPESEANKMRAYAKKMALARVAAQQGTFATWNLGVLQDMDKALADADEWGAFMAPMAMAGAAGLPASLKPLTDVGFDPAKASSVASPLAAWAKPGSYTVFKQGDELQKIPAYRHEDPLGWSFRAPLSTVFGSWFFDPVATNEFGGEAGWGSDRHNENIVMNYQAGESYMDFANMVVPPESGLGWGKHVFTAPPFFAALLLEPDMWSIGTATGSNVMRAPGVVADMFRSAKAGAATDLVKAVDAVAQLEKAGSLAAVAKAANTPDANGLVAQLLMQEVNHHIINEAMLVEDPANALPEVSNVALLHAAEKDPKPYLPPEVKQLGAKHATPSRAVQSLDRTTVRLDVTREKLLAELKETRQGAMDALDDIAARAEELSPGSGEALQMEAVGLRETVAGIYYARANQERALEGLTDMINSGPDAGATTAKSGMDLPTMRTNVSPTQIMGELYKDKGRLAKLLSSLADEWTAKPAMRPLIEDKLRGAMAGAGQTILRNVGEITNALYVRSLLAAQEKIARDIEEAAAFIKRAGTPEATAAAKGLKKLPNRWAILDDIRRRTATGRRLRTATSAASTYFQEAAQGLRASLEALAKAEREGVPGPGPVAHTRPSEAGSTIDFDGYMSELRRTYGDHVVDAGVDSRLGDIVRELETRLTRSGPEGMTVDADDISRLTALEEGLHMERWGRQTYDPTSSAHALLNTIRHQAWRPRIEPINLLMYRVYDAMRRRMDLPGTSHVGRLDERLQLVFRRAHENQRMAHKALLDVQTGRAVPISPNGPDGESVVTGVWALRDFMMTRRKYSGVVANQDWLTLHQKAWRWVKSAAYGDNFASDLIITALAGSPLGRFDAVTQRTLGPAMAAVGRAAKSAQDADEFIDILFRELPQIFRREVSRAAMDEDMALFIFHALNFGATQYDAMMDMMRIFGPSVSTDAAKLFNWAAVPESSAVAVGDLKAALRTGAQYGLPLQKEIAGQPAPLFQRLMHTQMASTRASALITQRGIDAGFGMYIPDAFRAALETIDSRLVKEMVEFANPPVARGLVGAVSHPFQTLVRLYDLTRTAMIAGYYSPRLAFPIGNGFSNLLQMGLEASGLRRGAQAMASTVAFSAEAVNGLLSRIPGWDGSFSAKFYEEQRRLIQAQDPVVEHFLSLHDGELVHFPDGRSVPKWQLLKEFDEDGGRQFLASPEMEREARAQARGGSGEVDLPPIKSRLANTGRAPTEPSEFGKIVADLPDPDGVYWGPSRVGEIEARTPAIVGENESGPMEFVVYSDQGATLGRAGSAAELWTKLWADSRKLEAGKKGKPGRSVPLTAGEMAAEMNRYLTVYVDKAIDGPDKGRLVVRVDDGTGNLMVVHSAAENSRDGRSLLQYLGVEPKAIKVVEEKPSRLPVTVTPQDGQKPTISPTRTPQGSQEPAVPDPGLDPSSSGQAPVPNAVQERAAAAREARRARMARVDREPRTIVPPVDAGDAVPPEAPTTVMPPPEPPPPPSRGEAAAARAKKLGHWLLYEVDIAATPWWIRNAMEYFEAIESRTRLAYYLRVQMEGATRVEAADRMRSILFDFTTGLSPGESATLGRLFMVYRYRRLWLRQLTEMLSASLTGVEAQNLSAHLTHQTQVGRASRQAKAAYLTHAMSFRDDDEMLSDQEQLELYMMRKAPWFVKSRAHFTLPLVGEGPGIQWQSDTAGRLITAEEVILTGASTLDQIYLLNAMIQTALIPLHGENIVTTPNVTEQWVEEFVSWADPRFKAAMDAGIRAQLGMGGSGERVKGVIIPHDQAVLVKRLLQLTDLHRAGWVAEDPDGTLRADPGAWPMLQLLIMSLPQISDAARNYAIVDNPGWERGAGAGVLTTLGSATGVADVVGFDPLTQHDYDVADRSAALERLLKQADQRTTSEKR